MAPSCPEPTGPTAATGAAAAVDYPFRGAAPRGPPTYRVAERDTHWLPAAPELTSLRASIASWPHGSEPAVPRGACPAAGRVRRPHDEGSHRGGREDRTRPRAGRPVRERRLPRRQGR